MSTMSCGACQRSQPQQHTCKSSRSNCLVLRTVSLLAMTLLLGNSLVIVIAQDASTEEDDTTLFSPAQTQAKEDADSSSTCPIVALLPFTHKGTAPPKEFSLHVAFDHMAAALMAIDDFNTKNPSVVNELASQDMATCDVTLPVIPGWTFADDGDFTTTSVAALLEAGEKRDICAVVGPYRNKATLGAAHVTGAMESPLISYGAADTAKVGRVHLYPLTMKITADSYDRADAIMDYLKNYRGRDYITLLHGTDLVDGPMKVMDKAAKKFGMNFRTEAFGPPFEKMTNILAIPNALKRIRDSGYRTIIVATYTSSYWDYIETYAAEYGLTGGAGSDSDYFWMSYDTTDVHKLTEHTDSENRQKLFNGMGTINVLDGFSFRGEEDSFLQSWKAKNSTFIKRLSDVNPIQPTDPGYFSADSDYFTTHSPSQYSGFIYDSIIALGMGACHARAKELQQSERHLQMIKYPKTGTNNPLFNELAADLEFEGASGPVVLNNGVLYNRAADTIAYGMYNLRYKGDGEFEHVLTSIKKPGGKWAPNEGNVFMFADNTITEPMMKTPEEENKREMYLIIGFLCAGFVSAILVFFYVRHKRQQSDSVWTVNPSDLKFHSPPEVIGQGTFGLVVLAEYRGTQVAVKRVLPVSGKEKSSGGGNFFISNIVDTAQCVTSEPGDIESGNFDGKESVETDPTDKMGFRSNSFGESDPKLLGSMKLRTKTQKRLRKDFIAEMRHLSKLRHPCITTVMGAVTANQDPMLVMEFMDHGSLYDLLHNDTLLLEGDLVLPILRDIAQGLRFLHAATPQVIHGDLKAANVLVDSKFRAKVADFGLSQKKRLGATGTPFWMAPELLRREGPCTAASDMYSFGIILYEVYSRKDPYEGESYKDVISMVADPFVNKRPPPPESCPEPVRKIMMSCLKDSASFRPSSEELDKELKRLDVASAGPRNMSFSMQVKKKDENNEHALLYELLPRHVADQLRKGEKVEPESRDLVTIFFSDIVGFTNISSDLPALKISHMLDRLYGKFDELSHKHDVFKVETIGDAYMAVTNLTKDQPNDHAKRIAQFSIDAIKAANETLIDVDNPSKGYVTIRVGFHSGPVVANVVGTRNPRYCLFGDTVNTASRMESNSEKNRVHCSARAAGLLLVQCQNEMVLENRGRINIKGKGEMRTFWVTESSASKRLVTLSSRRSSLESIKLVADVKSLQEFQGSRRKTIEFQVSAKERLGT